MAEVRVRYYAGARAAAGVVDEGVEAVDVRALLAELTRRHGDRLGRILAVCTVLIDGTCDRGRDATLTAGSTVEILPPFAGG